VSTRAADYDAGLVRELCKLPRETEWAEFKRNKAEPQQISEYISALANSAALAGKNAGYLLWGVDDDTHDIVGTSFAPASTKIGNEELESWLLRLLSPKLAFRFADVSIEGKRVVLLEVPRAASAPVQFQGSEFTNTSLRQRFGLDEKNSATASRCIKEAVEARAIVPAHEGAAKKLMRYVPVWAAGAKPGAGR
jgi:predicted HTH transcriptional regulator